MAAKKRKLCGDSGQVTAKGKPCTNPVMKGKKLCGTHGAKNVGRPPITPNTPYAKDQTLGAAICGLVRLGQRKGPAAVRVRVDPTTVESWIERGETDMEAGKQSEFSEFVLEMRLSRSAFETDALEAIHKAVKGTVEKPGDWRAALAMLERAVPEHWSPKHQIEHSGEINLVERHAEQLLTPLMAILDELGVVDDPRVPDLIEKHFTALERTQ